MSSRSFRFRGGLGILCWGGLALLFLPCSTVRADEPVAPPAPVVRPALALVEVTAEGVNVRVGPRLDNRPVTTLSRGDVLLLVEEVPGWRGVRIPAGFPVAVSLDYVVPEGPHAVRVMARNLNLRVEPPERGSPAPGIFRDHPMLGQLLTLIDVEDPESPETATLDPDESPRPFGHRWAWVVAPEEVRAYVSEKFLRPIERTPANLERLEAARAQRKADLAALEEARQLVQARESAMRLMGAVGEVQQELFHLRREDTQDKAPIVALATRLEETLAAEPNAMPSVLRLAYALREDLDREIALRVARHDAALAEELGRAPKEVPLLAPKIDRVRFKGIVRYEPTPGWREDGVFFLWMDGKPAYVLRGGGMEGAPGPLRDATDGREHLLEGALVGERLFGLPVLEVRGIR